MKNSVAIISAYFGKLPEYFPLWLNSCIWNPGFTFLLFTDQELELDCPSNVRLYQMTFTELQFRIKRTIGAWASIEKPYKLCDYKPAFGIIFEEKLKEFSYWGHCDLDQIMGNLSHFITQDRLNKYDILYHYGHLMIYRNCNNINTLFQKNGWKNWKKVLSSPIDYAFDECGMKVLAAANGVKKLEIMDGADLLPIPDYLMKAENAPEIRNHDRQVFYWEEGSAFTAWIEKETVNIQEAAYIHFSKRRMPYLLEMKTWNAFYIGPYGFVRKKHIGIPAAEEIDKINPYPGAWRKKRYYLQCNWKHQFVRRAKRKVHILWRTLADRSKRAQY